MAKKSRKMGGVLTDAAALTVGAAVASKVTNINLPVIPEKLRPALPIVLGIFLMNRPNAFMKSVGAGMVAAGGVKLVGQLAPGLGIGAGEGISEYTIEGAEDYALAGADNEMITGMDTVGAYSSSYALAGVDTNTDMMG